MKRRNIIVFFFSILIGAFLCGTEAEALTSVESPQAVLYSASDFQNSEGHAQGAKELEEITKQIYNSGNKEVSEALICGDYYASDDISEDESGKGIDYIYEVLNSQWELEHDEIYFVQGNHDPLSTAGLDSTGGTDREHYSVYQINHDDYMWIMSSGVDIETKISETAGNLRDWLNEKTEEGYSKPIFIITHLPLHHSYRYDNPYSEYLFDVLNEAGERGLNIVYLFGHNHSKEYDNYLGGSAVYLSKGDEILIPKVLGNNSRDYQSETLNFTYMNAGYIGKTSDGVLSSCIFKIYEDRIEVQRYTKEGIINLKDIGVSSENDLSWKANTDIKKSPQIIDLNQGIISWDETIDSEKILTDISKPLDLKVNVQNLENYNVVWECDDTDIAEICVNESDITKARITGKEYGTAQVLVSALDSSKQIFAKLKLKVLVVPEKAVCLSYGEYVRFYGLVAEMSSKVIMSENIENDYIISNSDQTGIIKAFAAQADEYLGTEELRMIYVPGVGNVLTENREKNVLWRFTKMEEMLDAEEEYQLQISPKSLLRDRYYLAVTSGVDSGLGYPNLANMRTCSKDTSAGAAVFRFDNESERSNYLMTTHHYKDRFKENEYGTFYFTYDNLSDQFVLSNQPEQESVYFYERISEEISDVLMWTDASEGKAHIGDVATEQTGGVIYVMHEGNIEEIPITLGMLSGVEEVSGKHICTLSFNGKVLSENYELDLKNDWFMLLKSWIIELFN